MSSKAKEQGGFWLVDAAGNVLWSDHDAFNEWPEDERYLLAFTKTQAVVVAGFLKSDRAFFAGAVKYQKARPAKVAAA